jgi:hypothetical protein
MRHFGPQINKVLIAPDAESEHLIKDTSQPDADPESIQAVNYDENLLSRVHTQWLFGEWNRLTQIQTEALKDHPDRNSLILLIAAAHLQNGNIETGKKLVLQAQEWGCDKKKISKILISGVYNSLGRASVLIDQPERAHQHFQTSIALGAGENDVHLISEARIGKQLEQLKSRKEGR